jgi:hypothetical protein
MRIILSAVVIACLSTQAFAQMGGSRGEGRDVENSGFEREIRSLEDRKITRRGVQ